MIFQIFEFTFWQSLKKHWHISNNEVGPFACAFCGSLGACTISLIETTHNTWTDSKINLCFGRFSFFLKQSIWGEWSRLIKTKLIKRISREIDFLFKGEISFISLFFTKICSPFSSENSRLTLTTAYYTMWCKTYHIFVMRKCQCFIFCTVLPKVLMFTIGLKSWFTVEGKLDNWWLTFSWQHLCLIEVIMRIEWVEVFFVYALPLFLLTSLVKKCEIS